MSHHAECPRGKFKDWSRCECIELFRADRDNATRVVTEQAALIKEWRIIEAIGERDGLREELSVAVARVTELTAGNAKLYHQNTDLMNEVDDLKAQLEHELGNLNRLIDERNAVKAQLEAMREALRPFTLHRDNCAKRGPERPCDCGLDAALSASTPKAERCAECGRLPGEALSWPVCAGCAKAEPIPEGALRCVCRTDGPTACMSKAEPRECEYSTSIGVKCPPDRAALMRVAEAAWDAGYESGTSDLGNVNGKVIDCAAIVKSEAP